MSSDSVGSASRRATRTDEIAPWLEFMLVGGATLVLVPLAWLLKRTFGLGEVELAAGFLTFYGAYLVNDPHFAVTYVLFYRGLGRRAFGAELDPSYRWRYVTVAFFVPAVLVGWAVYALLVRSPPALGWLIQLMFLLVGWHYVKQGFGVMNVLCARRAVRVAGGERRIILLHCFPGWAYAWASPAAPAGEFEEKGVVYSALAHPAWLEATTGIAFALSTIALVAMLIAKWHREGRMFPLAPLSGLLITVWSWTIYSSAERVVQYAIPALHSIQYLYFVWLMRRNEARAGEGPPSFGRPVAVRVGALAVTALMLGWALFRVGPTLLDGLAVSRSAARRGVGPLGATPCFAAIFVVVNIHHYFMDAVIWRRENPDTRFLRG